MYVHGTRKSNRLSKKKVKAIIGSSEEGQE